MAAFPYPLGVVSHRTSTNAGVEYLVGFVSVTGSDGETGMPIFSDVVDAAEHLSTEEQEELLDILRRRLAERRRAEIVREVQEARAEVAAGQARAASVDEIMDEATREP